MILIIQQTLQACHDNLTEDDCNNRGVCNENLTCTCQIGFITTPEAPYCTICGEGYVMSTDGTNRCVNIKYCMTDEKKEMECYNHGFCTANDETDPDTKWYCKCVDHYESTGIIHPTNCENCMAEYLPNAKNDKCLAKQCTSNITVVDDKQIATECSDYGTCIDPEGSSYIGTLIIELIEKLLAEFLDVTLPGCLCKGKNMEKMCSVCKKQYTQQIVENKTDCYPNLCQKFNETQDPIIDPCNKQGTCNFDLYREEFVCKCNGNYTQSSQCTECINKYELSSGCTKCTPGYDINSSCFHCTFGKDESTGCQKCIIGYNETDNCMSCLGGYDVMTRCEKCPTGLIDNGEKCVDGNMASSQAAIISIGVLLGVVALIAIIWIILYVLRKKRSYTVVNMDEDENVNAERNNT